MCPKEQIGLTYSIPQVTNLVDRKVGFANKPAFSPLEQKV